MKSTLLPCPFCGGQSSEATPMDLDGIGAWWGVYCPKCGTEGPSGDTEDEAITFWNTRMSPQILRLVEHRLIEMENEADAMGSITLGTKTFALWQFIRKLQAEQDAQIEVTHQ